ncbi:MAG: hypothetical protein KGJ23_07635 [Euryarchaeota archaeon]|nr:hypothetical protein [Euryarchaeota archaeon]MDE1836470.1 hypothetical protein [Euryarchaeota archaeon]MDE1880637.1 hypothetical protein [Euryarchaeota archaeon]MDE2044218.1 hypothetical protein [Thermoplasmata archaeon]
MAGGGAAIALGVVLLLLGCYLLLGPYSANRSYYVQPEQASPFSLPSWFVFPVGTTIQIAWNAMQPSSWVSVYTCSSISSGVCEGKGPFAIANGSGNSGSETFTAAGGQLYGIVASDAGTLVVTVQFSSAYGALMFLVFTMSVTAFAVGYMHMFRRDRYRPF